MIVIQLILSLLFFQSITQMVFAKDLKQHKAVQCDINFENIDLCARVNFLVPPNRKKSSDFSFKLIDSKRGDVVKHDYQVIPWLWMKMKGEEGHGSDPIKLSEKGDHYVATNVWFLMEGDWELHIKLLKEGEVISQGKKVYCVKGRKHKCLPTQNH